MWNILFKKNYYFIKLIKKLEKKMKKEGIVSGRFYNCY